MEPKGNLIELSIYIFKIWFKRSEESLIVDVRSVNITLHLTFLKIYRKLMKFFLRFYLKKNKILRVHVKDKSCSSLQDFRSVTLLKRDSNTGVFL